MRRRRGSRLEELAKCLDATRLQEEPLEFGRCDTEILGTSGSTVLRPPGLAPHVRGAVPTSLPTGP